MSEFSSYLEPPRRRLLQSAASARWRLAGGLLGVVVVPINLSFQNPVTWLLNQGVVNATCGSLVALLFASYLLKQIASFPGIRIEFYILQAISSGYAAALAVLVLVRLDYNRSQLIESYIFAVAWYFAVAGASERQKRPTLAVVPGGDASRLTSIPGAHWILLNQPELPRGRCDAVVADLRADLADDWERFIADCAIAGKPVYHMKQVMESLTGRVEIEHLSENNLGSLVPNYAYSRVKWTFDWLLAAFALIVSWPVLAAIAVLIRLDSPGPALFRQERMGFRGRPFTVYKFRTMTLGGSGTGGVHAAITVAADARITRIGRALRRTRLDELPQILNILSGEMSWIGPRPEAMPLSQWYAKEIPFYRYRHIVRPGISGWAQVNQGHVADVDAVTAKLHFDFFYIRNFSPWLDLLIVMRTFATIVSGFGAK